MRILVVDDEPIIVKGLKFNLENEGYDVDTASDGEAAVDAAKRTAYDAILLDLMMPKLDGMSACREIREFSSVPIIILTAKDDDREKLVGFESGADDYITKPFNILELKSRMRAIFRRVSVQSKHPDLVNGSSRIELDTEHRGAIVEGREVSLTLKEYDLLETFVLNPGKVYSREDLLREIWGEDFPGGIRTVDVHVRRIREKLEDNPADPKNILTRWGVGYYYKA